MPYNLIQYSDQGVKVGGKEVLYYLLTTFFNPLDPALAHCNHVYCTCLWGTCKLAHSLKYITIGGEAAPVERDKQKNYCHRNVYTLG